MTDLRYTIDGNYINRHKGKLKEAFLSKNKNMKTVKVAVLGGSTTHILIETLELYLLNIGFLPIFYESDYARYWEEAMFENQKLKSFSPDIIYIHTNIRNIDKFPSARMNQTEVEKLMEEEVKHFTIMLDNLKGYKCPIIANNFEKPFYRVMGNYDACCIYGKTYFIEQINLKLKEYIMQHDGIYLNDIDYLSSYYGIKEWSEPTGWYMYKMFPSMNACPLLAKNISNIISAIYGKTKKIIAVDLDNTLWGGVVGEEGIDGIAIGNGDGEAEMYLEFQQYLKELRDTGILLAVVSKNDYSLAIEAINQSDGLLKEKDFSAIKANWNQKSNNIKEISRELSITPSGFLFVDDNPMEREEVSTNVLGIDSPCMDNAEEYIKIIDQSGFFEKITFSEDDKKRNRMYEENRKRSEQESLYLNYNEYLYSLDMVATIGPFQENMIARITQLANKTNQFNLTTCRYTENEIQAYIGNDGYITICAELEDKFGKNGLVSLLIAEVKGKQCHIVEWAMSCRVIKRNLEYAMFDELVRKCCEREIVQMVGYYLVTEKNQMVENLYGDLGFYMKGKEEKKHIWIYEIPEKYQNKNTVIECKGDNKNGYNFTGA